MKVKSDHFFKAIGRKKPEKYQAPVVQTVNNAIPRINHYPLDIAIGFAITYPVDSDLSGG